MADPFLIKKLYDNVLRRASDSVATREFREGVKDMKDAYMPDGNWEVRTENEKVDYNDASRRASYVHKYAACHAGLVCEMTLRMIGEVPEVFNKLLGSLRLCCLGGGPGTDAIGILYALGIILGPFSCNVAIVDYYLGWKETLKSTIKELRFEDYGPLTQMVSYSGFHYDFVRGDLLGTMQKHVNAAIASANLLTMIKFLSAAKSQDTERMIKKILNSMRPGAVLLFIDNAAGGQYELVSKVASECNLRSVFGPLKHEHYKNEIFSCKRLGVTSMSETRVTVQMWEKMPPLPGFVNLQISRLSDRVSGPGSRNYSRMDDGHHDQNAYHEEEERVEVVNSRRNQNYYYEQREEEEVNCCTIS